MVDKIVFDIARFTEDGTTLTDRVQLLRRDGELIRRRDADGEEMISQTDAALVIRADPRLSEIRLGQNIRITADTDLLSELPFVLTTMEHDDTYPDEWTLTVNDEMWAPFRGDDGDEYLLPTDGSSVRLSTTWARLTFSETASMVSGEDGSSIGVAASRLVVGVTDLDPGVGSPDWPVSVRRRGSSPRDDAQMFVSWLTGNGLVNFLGIPPHIPVRLFVEATLNTPEATDSWWGNDLSEAFGDGDHAWFSESQLWTLSLDLTAELESAVLEAISDVMPEMRSVITSARESAARGTGS